MASREVNLTERFKKSGQALAVIAFSISLICLIEIGLGLQFIRNLLYLKISILPLSGIFYMIYAFSIFIKNKEAKKYYPISNALCFLVITICLLKLIAVIYHLNFYPEYLIFKEDSIKHRQILIEQLDYKGFLLFPIFQLTTIPLAIILIDYETKNGIRPTQILCFINIFGILVQLYSWLYKIHTILHYTITSVLGSLIIYSITLAILFARPDKGTMKALVGNYSTENITLRILALIVPLFIGWLRLEGESLKLYPKEFGAALFAIIAFLISIALLARNVILQDKARRTRISAQEKIREREERFKTVLNNIQEGVSVSDKNGNLLYCNRICELLFGKEIWNSSFEKERKINYKLFHMDGVTPYPVHEIPLYKAMVGETVQDVEMIVKNNEYPEGIALKVKGVPIKNSSGQVTEGVSIFQDITYRKFLKEINEEEERDITAVLMSLGEGVIVIDSNGKIILFNSKAIELLGKGSKEMHFRDWPKYYGIYQGDQKTIFSSEDLPIYQAIHGESTSEIELYIKNEIITSGRKLKSTGSPVIDEGGRITGAVVIFREVI